MPENARTIVEIVFNVAYLLVVWGIVIVMWKRWSIVKEEDKGAALWILLAFAFLALGDTGHVGFRVVAFAKGGIDTTIAFMGTQWYLVSLGAIATAWTFTVFYVCMIFMWQKRYNKPFGAIAWIVIALAVARSIIMLLPGNGWNSLVNDTPLYLIRNLPLMLMQIGTIYLFLRDAAREGDAAGKWIAYMILISFVCYAPVVFLIVKYPLIGMLMIPKTLAYLGIAFIGFKALYMPKDTAVN